MSAGETETITLTVTVDSDELREWAGKHADSGQQGVAHVLYVAAKQVEIADAILAAGYVKGGQV